MRQTDPGLVANRNVLSQAGILAAGLLLVAGCTGTSASHNSVSAEPTAPITAFPSSSASLAPSTPAPTSSLPVAALEAAYPACGPDARDTAIGNFNEGYNMYLQGEATTTQPVRNADAIRSIHNLGATIYQYQNAGHMSVQRTYFDKTGFFQEATDASLNNVDLRYVYDGGQETGPGCTVLSIQIHPNKSVATSPSPTDFDVTLLGVAKHALHIGHSGRTISQADGTALTPQDAADIKLVTQFAGPFVALAAQK